MKRRDPFPTYVALDLETTGLDSDQDAITEIGAVKFQGQRAIETFQSLVNPYREIPEAIQRLTGIAQSSVDRARPFGAIVGELRDFIGSLPVVGHNISFDLKFLSRHGLQLNNESYDTWDLASILLPYTTDYSLSGLVAELGTGHTQPHRALSDAQATHQLFVALLERARALDPTIAGYIRQLAGRARWPVGRLFEEPPPSDGPPTSRLGLTGLDNEALSKRLTRPGRAAKASKDRSPLDEEELATYLAPGGLFARAFPGFEHRPQQVEMLRAAVRALNGDDNLIAEAGTGVGKSLAYLLPAVLYSLRHGRRVIVSTNTINLQEQLLQKDIPALVSVLEGEGIIPTGEFRAVPLKGRANYLCLRRWNHLAKADSLSGDDTRLLSKTLIWLGDTSTADRGEINLSGRDAANWNRISAGEKGQCPGTRGEGLCFLRAARDRADGAHMIVVNHALLMSDLALGGGLLPEYDHLIIDEAHHLEEEATRQLGFQVSQKHLDETLDALGRLLVEARLLFRGLTRSSIQTQQGEELLEQTERHWLGRVREVWDRLWGAAEVFLGHNEEGGGERSQLLITRSTRAQPGWSGVEIAWENVDVNLTDGIRQMDQLHRTLDTLPSTDADQPDGLGTEISAWQEGVEELQERLKALVAAPPSAKGSINWMDRVPEGRGDSSGRSYSTVLHSAPLNVGSELDARLYSRKASLILTSATLSTQGNFDYIRERIGLGESGELLVASPFDYTRAALLLIPEDMPMPDAWGYQQAMEKVIVDLVKDLKGRTLVLFTSHAALKSAAQAVRGPLEEDGIRVHAQGIDGSPRQVLQRFSKDPRSMILGTSSFWEGVDLSGGILKALVLARLPFHVPSDPIFAARSTEYEDSFHQYALPQAVLRFRQGIGRLIRSSQDRGAILVLDKRIIARSYGKSFLDSIPPCTVKLGLLSSVPGYAADWVGNGK